VPPVAEGVERKEVLEIVVHRKGDLGPDVGDLYLAHHQSQVLDGTRSTGAAISDEAGGLVVLLPIEEVDRVLERGGSRVVVFGCDEDESVEG
jgi:hypothetical protein